MIWGDVLIDWVRIADLKSEIGDDGFSEVVVLFLDEMEEVVSRLRTSPDPVTYEADLHFLKGGAWNLGFAHFGGLCEAGERKAATNLADQVDIPAVIQGYEFSKVEFIEGLGRGGFSGVNTAA